MPKEKQRLDVRYTIEGRTEQFEIESFWPLPLPPAAPEWADELVSHLEKREGVQLLLDGQPFPFVALGEDENIQPITIETSQHRAGHWRPYLGKWEYIFLDDIKGPKLLEHKPRGTR